jgi:hypothetical protein
LRPLLPGIVKSQVVGLASPQDGVNDRVERAQAAIDRARPAIEPFHVTIWLRDVTVGARGDIDDYLSPRFHNVVSLLKRVRLVRNITLEYAMWLVAGECSATFL